MTDSGNNRRKKILFLTSRYPWPLEKGDKLRAYHLIKVLSVKADVILFAVNDWDVSEEQLNELRPYCKDIKWVKVSKRESIKSMLSAALKSLPFQAAYFYSNDALNALKSFADFHKPDIVLCHLLRMAPYAAALNIENSFIDYMDAFAKGMERYANTAPFYIRPAAAVEAARVRKYESVLFERFKYHSIISEQDRNCIEHNGNNDIMILPNGVDTAYYHPLSRPLKQELIFLGNMAYPPNITSVQFTVKKILPALEKISPGCRLLIAGATPSPEVKALASDKVKVSGWVDDPREELASSAVMIAPMLISIGLQNKILQAMAMKIPCVVSSLANNAIGAVHGESILVADTPEDYAKHISTLLKDDSLRKRIAENGYHLIKEKFSWEAAGEKLYSVFNL